MKRRYIQYLILFFRSLFYILNNSISFPGKHPVSLLAEHCMKRQIDMPKYNVVFEYGNIHSKSVLVSVTVGGKTFEPSQPSPYKKHGKAAAARVALKGLGFEKAIIET